MAPVSSGELLLVGRVLRPHGKKGDLRILPYARSEFTFSGSGPVFLKTPPGKWHEARVRALRPHKNFYLLDLEGVDSIQTAEDYRGAEIFVSKEKVSRETDEYFWYELLGLEVYLDSGEYVGHISQIIPTPSGDIYLAKDGEKEVYIPGAYEVIEDIDLQDGKMTIHGMEGLLDLNEV